MEKIKMYMYSKLAASKVTNEIEDFAAANDIEIVHLDKTIPPKNEYIRVSGNNSQKDAAIIYARFSSSNQKEISILGQLSECFSCCERMKWTVSAIYVDLAQTGTNSNRGAFTKLHNDILDEKYNGYRYVVYSTNRFGRNRAECSNAKNIYKNYGIKVIYSNMLLDDSPEGTFMEGSMEVMDEYFSKNLATVVKRGMKERAKQCRYTGGYVPYGFKINPETKLYEIEESEAENVRLLFKLYNEKVGFTEILNILTEKGARTRTGKPFSKNSLGDMISNPKYVGTYVYNRRSAADCNTAKRNSHKYKDVDEMIMIPNGIPAIVDEKTFELAQKRKEENKYGTRSRREKEDYLLTGLVYCKECGHAFTGNRRFSGRNKTKYVTYRCTNHNKGEKCNCKEVNKDYLESFVIDIICKTMLVPENVNRLIDDFRLYQKEQNKEYSNKVLRLHKEKQGAETAKENLFRALEKGMAADQLLARIEEKDEEIKKYDVMIEQAENNRPKEVSEEEFQKLLTETKKVIRNKETEGLRRMISFYISRIDVGKDDISVVLSYCNIVLLCGGGEGSRTPVRKNRLTTFYERSCLFSLVSLSVKQHTLRETSPLGHDRIQGSLPFTFTAS